MQPNNYEAVLEYNITPVIGDVIECKWYKDNELIPVCEPKMDVKEIDKDHIKFVFTIITKLIPGENKNVLRIKGDATYVDV